MFIVILDVLKLLTFNSHLNILYFSLTNGRKEILWFLFIFLIVITAFASYLHVTDGYLVYDFRSPLTTILTMFQILLAMISLKKHPELSSLHSQIIISFFSFVMTLVLINFFISMLNCYFTRAKETQQNSMYFLQELNKHFWTRLNSLFCSFWEVMTFQKALSQGKHISYLLTWWKCCRSSSIVDNYFRWFPYTYVFIFLVLFFMPADANIGTVILFVQLNRNMIPNFGIF